MKVRRRTKSVRSVEVITGAHSIPRTESWPPLCWGRAPGRGTICHWGASRGRCVLLCALDQNEESRPKDQAQKRFNLGVLVVTFLLCFKFNFYL